MRAVVATTAAATLTLGLLSAPPVWAEQGPHSPADRTVPVPETWEPGQANTDPIGGDPPDIPWTPPGSEPEARTAEAEDAEAMVGTCDDGINRGDPAVVSVGASPDQ